MFSWFRLIIFLYFFNYFWGIIFWQWFLGSYFHGAVRHKRRGARRARAVLAQPAQPVRPCLFFILYPARPLFLGSYFSVAILGELLLEFTSRELFLGSYFWGNLGELLLVYYFWEATSGELFLGSYFWRAIFGKLFLGSSFWGAIFREQFLGNYFWEAVSGKLFPRS